MEGPRKASCPPFPQPFATCLLMRDMLFCLLTTILYIFSASDVIFMLYFSKETNRGSIVNIRKVGLNLCLNVLNSKKVPMFFKISVHMSLSNGPRGDSSTLVQARLG